jgi:hypothetical protein
MRIIRCSVISKTPGGKHIPSCAIVSPNKFVEILQFIFVDHLFRNLVEQVTQPSDYHLYVYWLIALIAIGKNTVSNI